MGSPEWFELLRKSFCVQPFVVDASQSLKPKSNPRRWWTRKQRGAKVLENCKIALSLPFTIQVPELHHGISSQRKKLSLISKSTQNRVQIKEPESRGGRKPISDQIYMVVLMILVSTLLSGRPTLQTLYMEGEQFHRCNHHKKITKTLYHEQIFERKKHLYISKFLDSNRLFYQGHHNISPAWLQHTFLEGLSGAGVKSQIRRTVTSIIKAHPQCHKTEVDGQSIILAILLKQ